MKSRIQIARPDIVKFFDESPKKILTRGDLTAILARQREFWRLTQKTYATQFIKFLLDHTNLKRLDLPFPYRHEHRYVWGDVPLLEVLLTIKSKSYFSHYTAVRMHGLTEQVPKTIYLNHEQPPHTPSGKLEQHRIDAAFSRRARVSQNVIELDGLRVCLVNGMHTAQLGVIENEVNYDGDRPVKVRLTNIERTLIDIAVRPVYAGGVAEVLKAYRLAKEPVSVNRLAATLQKLKYVYPYHQVIGYYLERAGYRASSLDLLRRFPMEFDFYLDYHMKQTQYIKQWRLHVPKGF
jgi:predicted transcriptional regulator of viral defense system